MTETLRKGLLGEVLAARYLRDRGYKILAANYRTKLGELDIVASDDEYTCIVEVKTREAGTLLPPAEAVGAEKQRRLENTAASFVSQSGLTLPLRFDIIEVTVGPDDQAEINHIINAF